MLFQKMLKVEMLERTPDSKRPFKVGYYETDKGFHGEDLKVKVTLSSDFELKVGHSYLLSVKPWRLENGKEGFSIVEVIQEVKEEKK